MSNPLVPDVMPVPGDPFSAETERLQQQVTAELSKWETVIEDRLQAFFELGYALQMIREKGLYRLQYETFDAYCADRWDFSRQRAEQLMTSSLVRENLKQLMARDPDGLPSVGDTLPQNERQARVVARYSKDPGEQLTLWQEAVKTAPKGRMSAAHLLRVIDRLKQSRGETTSREPQCTIPDSTTRGGTLERTLCLFCRRQDVVIYPLGNTRQGICEECLENGTAYFAQVKNGD